MHIQQFQNINNFVGLMGSDFTSLSHLQSELCLVHNEFKVSSFACKKGFRKTFRMSLNPFILILKYSKEGGERSKEKSEKV